MALNTPTLDDLVAQLPPQLGQAMRTPEELEAYRQMILQGTMPEALRQYGEGAQRVAESNFGRGMGLSSYNAYQQALQSLMESEGAAKIQLAAQQQAEAAQRAAVGNAMSYATSERNRAQQASEGAANRANAQQMQRRGIKAGQQGQMMGQIYGGAAGAAGGLVGTLAKDLMRPEGESSAIGRAGGRLMDLIPGSGDAKQVEPASGLGAGNIRAEEYSAPQVQLPASAFDAAEGGYEMPSFESPNFDLSSLFQDFDWNQVAPNYDWSNMDFGQSY